METRNFLGKKAKKTYSHSLKWTIQCLDPIAQLILKSDGLSEPPQLLTFKVYEQL